MKTRTLSLFMLLPFCLLSQGYGALAPKKKIMTREELNEFFVAAVNLKLSFEVMHKMALENGIGFDWDIMNCKKTRHFLGEQHAIVNSNQFKHRLRKIFIDLGEMEILEGSSLNHAYHSYIHRNFAPTFRQFLENPEENPMGFNMGHIVALKKYFEKLAFELKGTTVKKNWW